MKNNIKILDCTLRDGGYINNWEFKKDNIEKILKSLNRSHIDIIECGYLNDRQISTENSTLFNNFLYLENYINNNIDSKKEVVIMINLGDFDITKLVEKKNTFIDGIRLAFHKKDLDQAIEKSKIIINLGYKLYFQPMVTKNYSDLEFLSLLEKINNLNIYSFYIVDSFGSMTLKEFNKYLTLADNNLSENVVLGYHSHNNMQLAFSNAINMCTFGLNRTIIVDSSIYGIGRGAGNLNTELIAEFLNNSFKKKYNILPLLDIIDELLFSLMKIKAWGFSPAQYLSASVNCHPNYATHLINKNTNNIVSIKKILDEIPENKKNSFDKKLIEELYLKHILESKSKIIDEKIIHEDSKVLLIASGKSTLDYREDIENIVQNENYINISLNHISNITNDYYLFTNQKRLEEFENVINPNKLIITNNLETNLKPKAILDFSKLIIKDKYIVTNSAIIAINYLISQRVGKVKIAGLDGYSYNGNNYSYEENQLIYDKEYLEEQNTIILNSLSKVSNEIDIELITPSKFKGLF